MLQTVGSAPLLRCSAAVPLPPVNAFQIFFLTTSGWSTVNMLVSGMDALIFPPAPKSWEEAAVDLGGFVVAEFLGYVAGYSPVGVLVDGCWDECGDVFAC